VSRWTDPNNPGLKRQEQSPTARTRKQPAESCLPAAPPNGYTPQPRVCACRCNRLEVPQLRVVHYLRPLNFIIWKLAEMNPAHIVQSPLEPAPAAPAATLSVRERPHIDNCDVSSTRIKCGQISRHRDWPLRHRQTRLPDNSLPCRCRYSGTGACNPRMVPDSFALYAGACPTPSYPKLSRKIGFTKASICAAIFSAGMRLEVWCQRRAAPKTAQAPVVAISVGSMPGKTL